MPTGNNKSVTEKIFHSGLFVFLGLPLTTLLVFHPLKIALNLLSQIVLQIVVRSVEFDMK